MQYDGNSRLNPGTVVWAEVARDDGMGKKARPCLVDQDDDRSVRLLYGSTQFAKASALREGEILVSDMAELKKMGLDKPTRFSFRPGMSDSVQRKSIKLIIGDAPKAVLGRLYIAYRLYGSNR